MSRSKKLELTWVGKDEEPRLEPRILIEDVGMSYCAAARAAGDFFDNRLIQGDNLLALKALEAEFSGKVNCIFIDPPYNTGSAFEYYDDSLEHSLWLGMMRDRLVLLRSLLSDDGSIWVTIDDNELHYLKVLMDEIFGRRNFIGSAIWQHSVQGKGYSGKFSVHHNYVLAYRKSEKFTLNDLPRQEEHNVNYSNPDNDPRGAWRSGDVRNALVRPNLMYDITTPSGKTIKHPPKGWRFSRETFEKELKVGKIKFSKDESRIIRKIYLEDQEGRVPETLWFSNDVGTTREASAEVRAFHDGDDFDTPKPERLIERVLLLATNKGDLVLDSFAGSGTTGAVAHKMGRQWLMIELGRQATSLIAPRMQSVIDGRDAGGVTESASWKGGGGFRFYRLAPSLLERDRWGNWVISRDYNPEMLAEAMCKHMSFSYFPSQDPSEYWNHGFSSERDFIFVTTNALTHEMLEAISYDVGPDRHLLICCKAFSTKRPDAFQNLTLRRIPHAILHTCEWGRDDYSLKIASLPEVDRVVDEPELAPATRAAAARSKRNEQGSPGLFDTPAEAED
ncbi:MAG: site-specific DNA-methyltransferase [Chelatococcus sp.]|nr:MAG: site-specific DNA-methyltransferase [Chelatococcus sp.]